jgi:ABC-type uncharacterized transport system ATPase subunit
MIEACEAEKRFGDRSAVRSVSSTAQDRAITGLLGVNGAGKSTICESSPVCSNPREIATRLKHGAVKARKLYISI